MMIVRLGEQEPPPMELVPYPLGRRDAEQRVHEACRPRQDD